MTLQELSFRPEEVFPCEIHNHRILVPATVNDESVLLVLATGLASPAMLSLDYARERGFRFQEESDPAHPRVAEESSSGIVYVLDVDVRVLGRGFSAPVLGATEMKGVRRESPGVPVAGSLGVEFLRTGVLGLDIRGRAVGFARRDESHRFALPAGRSLRLIEPEGRYVPLTRDLRPFALLHNPTEPPVLLLSTSAVSSEIASDFIKERGSWISRWAARRTARRNRASKLPAGTRAAVPQVFDLPDGTSVSIPAALVPSYSSRAERLGVERIDGTLGMNFFERWLTVFDFPAGQVGLFEY